jgi:hypothetical protein
MRHRDGGSAKAGRDHGRQLRINLNPSDSSRRHSRVNRLVTWGSILPCGQAGCRPSERFPEAALDA